jgi:mannosyltransferase
MINLQYKYNKKDLPIILVGILTVIGLALRLYHLDFNSIWLDEAYTYSIAKLTFIKIFENTVVGEFNPPLFIMLERIMLFFGNNEFILRLIPALMGTATIPVMYYIGKEFKNEYCGVVTAILMTFSQFAIFYSQEARAYSMMLFLVAVVMYASLKLIKVNLKTDSGLKNVKIFSIVFGIFASLAIWTHFYTLIPIFVLLIFIIFKQRNQIITNAKSFAGLGIFVVGLIPLVYIMIPLFINRISNSPTYGVNGLNVIINFFITLSAFDLTITYIVSFIFIVSIIFLLFKNKNKFILLVSLILVTFITSIYLSYSMPMLPRYLIFLTIPIFLSIAYMVSSIKGRYFDIVVVGLLVLSVIPLGTYYGNFTKEDWRGLSVDFNKNLIPGDTIVVVPDYIKLPLDYYYNSTEHGVTVVPVRSLASITDTKSSGRIYYVVTGDVGAVDPSGSIVNWLNSNKKLVAQYNGIGVYSNG